MADKRTYEGEEKRRDESIRDRFEQSLARAKKDSTQTLIKFVAVTLITQGGWVWSSTILNNERTSVLLKRVDAVEVDVKAMHRLDVRLSELAVRLDQLGSSASKMESTVNDILKEVHRERMRRGLVDER